MKYLFNKFIDQCLRITYNWHWFNKLYAVLIKVLMVPILKFLVSIFIGAKLHLRHSIKTNDFRAFGSDIDLTIVGKIEKLGRWRILHKILKMFIWRLGEWEYFTEEEYKILNPLQSHQYDLFWEYLCKLRKLTWIKKTQKPGQIFKQEMSRKRVLKSTGFPQDAGLKGLLKDITGYSTVSNEGGENFEIESEYLMMKVGNRDSSNLLIENRELYHTFINLLPTSFVEISESDRLKELKYYICLRELFLTLASARYNNTEDDYADCKQWIGELCEYLEEHAPEVIFSIKIEELKETISL